MLLGGLRPHVLSHPVACFCFAVVLLCCCVAVLLCCCVAVLLGGGGGATEVSYPAGPPGAQPGFTIAATGFSYPGEPTTKTITTTCIFHHALHMSHGARTACSSTPNELTTAGRARLTIFTSFNRWMDEYNHRMT